MKRRTWPYLLIGLIVVGALALVVARPSMIFGVDREALMYSFDANDCQPVSGDDGNWICTRSVLTQPGSRIVEYHYPISVDSGGCWKADLVKQLNSVQPPEPSTLSDCITLGDILRLFSYRSAGS